MNASDAGRVNSRYLGEDHFRNLVENVTDVVTILDESGNIKYTNPAVKRVLGYEPEELNDKLSMEFLHPDDVDKVMDSLMLVSKNLGMPRRIEFRLRHRDGSWRTVDGTGQSHRDADGIMSIAIIYRDVTEQRSGLEKLSKDKGFIQKILDTNPSIVYIYDIRENRNVYSNMEITDLLGYTPEDVKEMGENLFPTLLHPQDAEKVQAHHAKLGGAKEGTIFELEYRMMNRAGDWRWLYSRDTVFATDDDGNPTQILGTAVDITERKGIDDEITIFKKFVEASGQGFGIGTFEGKITFINQTLTDIVGHENPDDLIGTSFIELYAPEPRERLVNEVIPTVMEKGEWTGELGYLDRRGGFRPSYEHFFIIMNDAGEPMNIAAVISDITEKKAVERELNEHREKLADLVRDRTLDLQNANEKLKMEIEERKKVQAKLEDEIELNHSIMNSLPGIFYMLNTEPRMTHVNQEFIDVTGYSKEEILGMNPLDFFEGDDKAHIAERIGETFTIGASDVEAELVTKDGSRRPYYFNGRSTMIDGQPTLVGLAIDVSERKRIEEDLRLKEIIFESSLAANSTADLTGKIIDVNPAFLRLWGYDSKEEAIGRTLTEFFDNPEDGGPVLEALTGQGKWEGEFTAKRKDGTTFLSRGLATTLLNSKGEVIGYQSANLDVTEQRRTEEALRKSEEKFRRLYESNIIGVMIANIDGNFTDANDRFLDMVGYERDDLPFRWDLATPEEWVEADEEAVSAIMETGTADPWEKEYFRKDGSRIPVLVAATTVPGSEELICWAVDITPIKEAEKALKEGEEKFRSIVENSSEWIWEVDAEARYTYSSPRSMDLLGYEPDELMGKTPLDLMTPDEAERTREFLDSPENAMKPFDGFENVNLHKDGHEVVLETSAVPVLDDEGNFTGYRGIDRDVTERRKVEDAIKESEEKFRTLADQSPNMIFIYNKGRILYINETAVRVTGIPEKEFLEKGLGLIQQIIAPEDLPKIGESSERHMKGEEVEPFDLTILGKDGKLDTIYSSKLIDYGGEKVVLGIVTDITERKMAEESLREKDNIIESASIAIATADLEGRMTFGNPSFLELWGFDAPDEFIGELFADYWMVSEIYDDVMDALMNGGTWMGDIKARRKDGSLFDVRVSAALVRNSEGEPVSLMSSSEDITLRKEAERALKESEERFRSLFDILPYSAVVIDLEGKLVEWNRKFMALHGMGEEASLKGVNVAETVAPESLKTMMESIGQMVRTGENVDSIEFTMKRADGSLFPTEASGSPIMDAQGRPTSIIAIAQDITERKRAESVLRENEEKFRMLSETSPLGVFIFTPSDMRFKYFNPAGARILGFKDGQELLEKGPIDMTHPDDQAAAQEYIGSCLSGGEDIQPFSFRAPRADGSTIDCEVMIRCIDYEGERAIIGTLMDITERKRWADDIQKANEELKRSNEELQRFAYVASHDLQEPLRKVSSFTELFARRYEGQVDEKADEYIHFITDGAHRMQGLINDLLEYSRVTTRAKPFKPTSMEEVLERIKRDQALRIEDADAVITSDDLPSIKVDRSQIEQVFNNIIGNALKFAKEDEQPRIHISVEERPDEWQFSVEDNGIGFEEQFADRIFVIFQRLHPKSQYPGTGIGLGICKKIVERHGGSIWAESEPGKGSTFHFTISKSPKRDMNGGESE